MSVDEYHMTIAESPATIDPFSFHLGSASCIAGLGGTERPISNDYVFHTPYVATASGNIHFIAKFIGLRATRGTLQLKVHMLPDDPGSAARVTNSERISLNRLIKQSGEVAIRFEGLRGVRFAFHGTIADNTDAVAESLTVLLDRPPSSEDLQGPVEARSTKYGSDATRSSPILHALRHANLTHPVSQAFTPGQLSEPAAVALSNRLNLQQMDPISRWSTLFVLRALDAYGLARTGARGLCVGAISTEVVDELLRLGCEVTVIGPPQTAHALRLHDCLHHVGIDPAGIGNDLTNFDFACSIDAKNQGALIAEKLAQLEQNIQTLRPGGFAINVMPFLPRHADETSNLTCFSRDNVERLALILISRGHQIAQLLLDGTGVPGEKADVRGASAYGLVMQRGPSPL